MDFALAEVSTGTPRAPRTRAGVKSNPTASSSATTPVKTNGKRKRDVEDDPAIRNASESPHSYGTRFRGKRERQSDPGPGLLTRRRARAEGEEPAENYGIGSSKTRSRRRASPRKASPRKPRTPAKGKGKASDVKPKRVSGGKPKSSMSSTGPGEVFDGVLVPRIIRTTSSGIKKGAVKEKEDGDKSEEWQDVGEGEGDDADAEGELIDADASGDLEAVETSSVLENSNKGKYVWVSSQGDRN